MEGREHHARLYALDRPLGDAELTLRIGDLRIRLVGLDRDLLASLGRRWGGFVEDSVVVPTATVNLYAAGSDLWIRQRDESEHYRIEACNAVMERVVVSYHFALGADGAPSVWRAGLSDEQDVERPDRMVENVVRYLVAELAIDAGGFAMHAAGVLRDGKAYLFAGPSRAGKSTATGLIADAESLGDDYAMVLPGAEGWLCPAVPFDNSESVVARPSGGLYRTAGVWRLRQSSETRTEQLSEGMAAAALLGCVAFPWAMPERADRILEQVRRFTAENRFERLHFSLRGDLWSVLIDSSADV